MLRRSLFATILVLAAPATASAAPFGELPSTAVSGSATCLRATGAPGELVRSSPSGARFLNVTSAGATDAGGVVTGVASAECPRVAARPNGAGIVAKPAQGCGSRRASRVAPGGRRPSSPRGEPRRRRGGRLRRGGRRVA
jgi:hypothetical protein